MAPFPLLEVKRIELYIQNEWIYIFLKAVEVS